VPRRARTVLIWVVVAFFVYAIFRAPDQAAGVVKSGFNGVAEGVSAVGAFFDALLA
jgi:hypothetical protein